MLKPVFSGLGRSLWLTAVGLVVLLAVYVSAGRWLSEQVADNRELLLQEIRDRTGLLLEADQLGARWSALAPVIELRQLRLARPDQPDVLALSVDTMRFKVDVLHSLLKWRLSIDSLTADGIEAALAEHRPGRWTLAGFGGEQSLDTDWLVDSLLLIDRARIASAQLSLQPQEGAATMLAARQLTLRHSGGFRRLDLRLDTEDSPEPLMLLVEASGDPRRPRRFAASAWLRFSEFDPDALVPLLPGSEAASLFETGPLGGQLWLEWGRGSELKAYGRLQIPHLDLSVPAGRELPPFENLQLVFAGQYHPGRWQIRLADFRADWAGQPLVLDGLSAVAEQQRLTLAVPAFDLARWSAWLLESSLLERESLAWRALSDLSPTGSLKHALLELPLAESAGSPLLRAELENVGVEPWRGAPGARGVDGYLVTGRAGGEVVLASDGLALMFPAIYKHTLDFNRAQASVQWRIDPGRVQVRSGPITVWPRAGDGPAVGLFTLDLPVDDSGDDPRMNLSIGLRDSAARYRANYLPHILDPTLLAWLDEALVAGEVEQGAFVYRGSIAANDDADRTVQLYFDVSGATVAFDPAWPPARAVDGQLWIEDGRVDVHATGATMLDDLRLERAHVRVRPASGAPARLLVDADVAGHGQDVLRLLQSQALAETAGAVVEGWEWQGRVAGTLELDLLLGKDTGQLSGIDLKLEVQEGELIMPAWELQFAQLAGPLRYSSAGGLSSTGISGDWRDNEFELEIAGEEEQTVLKMDTHFEIADLGNWLGVDTGEFVSGDTAASLRLSVGGGGDVLLLAHSDLTGVAVELPPPFGKGAQTPLPLQLTLGLGAGPQDLELRLGQRMTLAARINNRELEAATLGLGPGAGLALEKGWFTLSGEAEYFHAGQWQQVLEKAAVTPASPENDTESAGTASASGLALQARELHLDEAIIGGHAFNNLLIDAHQYPRHWQLGFKSTEFAGELVLPRGDAVPTLELDYLHLRAATDERSSGGDDGGLLAELKPGDVPEANVSIDSLKINDDYIGNITFALRSDEKSMALRRLEGELRGLRFTTERPTTLHWWRDRRGDHTRLSGHAEFIDFAQVLQAWNYEQAISSESGNLDFDLRWPGSPAGFEFALMAGELGLDIRDGRFLKSSGTATGALKMVGIFNFANVLRRLQFDFSDVYESGLSFDRIRGGMQFQRGNIVLVDTLSINGPGSAFALSGSINIPGNRTDLQLVATLPVGTNLPWIAALAGGLPVAAGVYVASKVFEDTVDRFSSAVYEISGPWTDPQVEFKKVFDDDRRSPTLAPPQEAAPPAPGDDGS